jgi:cell division protein FtsL
MSAPARSLAAAPAPKRQEVGRPEAELTQRRPHGHGMPEGGRGAPLRPRSEHLRASRSTRATRRKKHHLGFALLASTLVGAMVFAIVVLHVLLAQQSFRLDTAERRLVALDQENLALVREQATLSAPGRIAEWATRHGMRLPDDIRILRAPNGPSDPAGAGISSNDENGQVVSATEGRG